MRRLGRFLAAVFFLVFLAGFEGRTHARAAALLLRFESTGPATGAASFDAHEILEEDGVLDTVRGQVKTRTYIPKGIASPPGIVISHGVHHTGITEPRLQRFSRAIASAGVMVYTPELTALMDYRIDTSSEEIIGAAAHALATRANRMSVGIVGLSFGGGLSILTAADPRWASEIAFVVAIGAHDDLPRVARFFFENKIERPDGSVFELAAHDYGAMVLVYGNVERFFPAIDVPTAREAIKYWLQENQTKAREVSARLSPESNAKMEKLFTRKTADLKPDLMKLVDVSESGMHLVSPHGNLKGLRAPVYLLHGAGDSVIPSTETLWLAHDAPDGCVQNALISPAVVHVELEGKPSVTDQWNLVNFMAQIIDQAEQETPRY
jgi:pimeloyl-ACP methyl ester carboxylesterase